MTGPAVCPWNDGSSSREAFEEKAHNLSSKATTLSKNIATPADLDEMSR
jgi:hypothetical protein